MKFKHKTKKWTFLTLTAFTALAVGISISINLNSKVLQNQQASNQNSKIDPVQSRVEKYMMAGKGVVAPNSVGGGVSSKLSRASLADTADGTDLSAYAGQDIAKIGLSNIFTNGGTDSKSGSVYHQESRPNTGVIVVNTSVTNATTNVEANAYDYVNLKYVQYNQKTGVIIDVLSAPPPGLFLTNPSVWPTWKTDGTKNKLADFFPTKNIRNAIASAFGFTTDETFTETEWLAKLNAKAFTLDLKSLFLNSIAELFNPNLIWGFGIYDLTTPVLSNLAGTKKIEDQNEILYNGLFKIFASNNVLDYFPNPQFKNMPALRYIQANNNKIKAIGDFATYQTGDLDAGKLGLNDKPESYFLYLESLWEGDKYKNDPAVIAIKKWLTTELSTKSVKDGSGRGSIHNQNFFQYVISANDVYLSNKNGDLITASNKPSEITGSLPNASGNFGALNFASVTLNVSKSIYQIDFSHNEIERFPLSPVRFTYVNFSNNKLRYVPPIALQPLPWNYLANGVMKGGANERINLTMWEKSYKNDNTAPTTQITGVSTAVLTQNILAPSLQFNNNQILDWWPNNTKTSGANDGWYTWPNTNTGASTDPPVANTIASTYAQAPNPYKTKVDNNFSTSTAFYNAYLHRNFISAGSYGGVYNDGNTNYNSSAANLLGDWIASGYTSGKTADFYRYYFANKDDNVELFAQQNFSASLNFNLFSTDDSKQKNFVLPGYETSGKKETSIATFNSGKTSTSDSNNQTTDKYYDNLVPYVLGRTLPQNWTTANSWNGKNLKVELLNNQGTNLLSSFNSLSWKTVFDKLSTSSFSSTDNETNFIKQIIGALPNLNGTGSSGISDASNVAQGISRDLFKDQSRLVLKIQEATLGLNYTYNINVLNNLNYTAEAKNKFDTGADNSKTGVENIAASSFTKKASFASASKIQAIDLTNELDSWLNTSDYVKLYLANNPTALSITKYDIQKGEITVKFNVHDVNNNLTNLTGLENNTLIIKGFTPLSYSFVNDANEIVAVSDNAELDKITDQFLPNDEASVLNWVKTHFQVNWLGLELASSGVTGDETSAASHPNGYYKLSELKNDYVQNLTFDANTGALSFNVVIQGTAANDNIPLFFSKTLTSFWKFGMEINTSTYDQATKKSVNDYVTNPDLLKQFVNLAPTRKLNGGTTETKPAVQWSDTTKTAEITKYIPAHTTLKPVINTASTNSAAGVVAFDVKLNNTTTNALIATQSGTLSNLYNYNSQFGLKGNETVGTAGVRYLADSSKSSLTAKQLFELLKSYAGKQSDFQTWITPLIDYSKSDQTYDASTKTWSPSPLSDAEQKQLIYGFSSSVSLTENDIMNNVSYNDASNTLTINNLYVKGGYKDGNFSVGSATDALVSQLPNSTYSFFKQTTQAVNISSYTTSSVVPADKWSGTNYQGGTAYFKSALEKWKTLSPSQWLNQLLSLKNQSQSSAVNEQTYEINNYDTLFSFLNHVLNTSTSNNIFKTRVDINDLSQVQINDFAGLVTIPVNTLLIYNNYGSDAKSSPDDLTAQPKKYGEEIKFQLADYKSFLAENVKAALPWKFNDDVNAQFQAVSADAVKDTLTNLLTAAKKIYTNSTSPQDEAASLGAIQILANNFIADQYYDQPAARRFFSQKFNTAASAAKKDEYTEFSDISFSDIDQINGTMKVTVTLKNYISGYDTATSQYTLEDTKTHTFNLTNLLRYFGTPVWSSSNQTVKNQVTNLGKTVPDLHLFQPGTDTAYFSYKTIEKSEFSDYTAQEYYDYLTTNSANLVDGDYIKIGPEGLKFAEWGIVNNYGVSQETKNEKDLTDLVAKIKNAEIAVKKSDIHFSARTNQIYLLNPVVHFTGTYNNLEAKQAAMQNIFDASKNLPEHVPFGTDNNFIPQSLPNITLVGFGKVPTEISWKPNVSQIRLGTQTFAKNQVLPSQIYEWIQNNYSNANDLYELFTSFYNVVGTSDLLQPLEIILNPKITEILRETNGSGDISQWVQFNDGFGTINFHDAFFVVNTFQTKKQASPTPTALGIQQFMKSNSSANLDLTNLKQASFQNVESNEAVQNQISSSINTAASQLEKNNFALAQQLLAVNEIKTNLANDVSQLEITKVSTSLESGQITIHYIVRNTYANGKKVNMSGVYILNNFYSPIQAFYKYGLAPLIVGFAIIVLGVYFINRRYRNNMNTRKFTKKKPLVKKGQTKG